MNFISLIVDVIQALLKKNMNLIRSKWKMLNSGRQCSFISDHRPCGVIPFLAALYGPVNGVNYLLPSGQIWWPWK